MLLWQHIDWTIFLLNRQHENAETKTSIFFQLREGSTIPNHIADPFYKEAFCFKEYPSWADEISLDLRQLYLGPVSIKVCLKRLARLPA